MDTFRILLNRIREGDQLLQSDLVNQLQSYVIMMADRTLYQDIRAGIGPSDVAQKLMIKMLGAIDQYQGNTSSEFFGWLNRIIENEVKQSHRDLTRQKRDIRRRTSLGQIVDDSQLNLEPEECQLTPQSNALAAERVEIFHAALKNLPEDYQTVIRLRNLEQLSFPDVAKRMGAARILFRNCGIAPS